ncbi:MAG TPA: PAS domain-containing protein [Pricia sp.]|nr:PAS domain-containing protein [Pricia sp.]
MQRPKKDEKDLWIQQLERELARAGVDMRSITAEQVTANKELLIGSEELRSLNERMRTKKEALHSSNEELTASHLEKLGLDKQLIEARDYAEAIVDAVHEPLVVLDNNLRVKSANKAFYKTFGASEKDTQCKLISTGEQTMGYSRPAKPFGRRSAT